MSLATRVHRELSWNLITRGAAVFLFLVAILWLSTRIDIAPLGKHDAWWSVFPRNSRWLFSAGLVGSIAFALTFVLRVRAWPVEQFDQFFAWSRWQQWCLAGAVLLAIPLGVMVPSIIEPAIINETAAADTRVEVWFLLLLVCALGWVAALVPWRLFSIDVAASRSAALAGLAGGLGSIVLSIAGDSLWRPLSWLTLNVVHFVLWVLPTEVVYDPARTLIGTDRFQVLVAPVCSGYQGIGLMVVFLALVFWLFRRDLRFPHALILIPVGVLAIWLLNIVRIVALILIGHAGRPDVAVGGFHSQAGWLAFNLVGLGVVAVARCWPWIQRPRSAAHEPALQASKRTVDPTLAYLAPMAAIVLASMVGEALGDGAVGFYPLRLPAALAALALCWRGYADTTWLPSRTIWGVFVGVAVFAFWMALEPPSAASSSRVPVDLGTPWGMFWLACRVVGSVILVPIAEELAFRGYLMRRLIARDFRSVPMGQFTWVSFVVSSLLFGLLHQRWFAGALSGAAYAGAVYRHRRLGDAMLAHAVTNGLIAAWVLAKGQWSLWA